MKKRILSLILSFVIVFTMLIPFATITMSVKAEAVSYTADPNWYSADKSILEINDIPDFIAFMNKMNELGTTDNGAALGVAGNLAGISWTGKMPFEGQTIILNTDIVLNPGITFGTNGPSASSAYTFNRTSKQVGFGGTFDGQGHTISGLYIISNKGGSGSLFGIGGAATKRMNVVVRNLQIKNSLIENSAMGVASIFSGVAFNSHVLIENVYSEAILKSTAATVSTDSKLKTSIIGVNMGGFCGTVGGNLSIINSIYAGTFVTDTSKTPKKYVGGMVGNITNKTINSVGYSGNLTVENSAYYGTFEGSGVYIGKLSGDQTAGSTVTVNNSIFGGTMKSTASFTPGSGASTGASTYYIGRLIGLCTSNYTLKVAGTVATSTYKGSTAVGNYNSLATANSGSSVSVTVVIDSNLTPDNWADSISSNWVPNGTMNGYPVPASYISLFGVESLKHNYVTELPLTARDLFEQLGVKKENAGIYTEGSYRRYSEAYDDIVGMIFATDADLTKIDVPTLKANAEVLLKTPADEKREELIILLGEKIENTDNYYTASSYEAYSSAYEQIVNSLNSATTVDALNNIDVATLRANAEAKLVTSSDNLREELIGLLGEKIANTDNYYTASSYEAYSSAYDAILKSLNDAASVDALNKIDVVALKSAAEAKLKTSADELRSELKNILGEKLTNANGQYTNDSYSAYSSAYEQIVNSLNSATTVDALNKIDVATLRANAEAKLVLSSDNLREELIGLLGEKIANTDNYYTASSYEAYSSAYDAILKSLNDAASVDALNKIDVVVLKSAAEAKLKTSADELRSELKSILGEKLTNANGQYTNDSYLAYSSAYEQIVNSLNSATTVDALNNIDVATLKAAAEAKLITLADKLRNELKSVLGEKISNAENHYTTESYAEYSSAYDAIIRTLDSVTTVDALNNINVATLKLNAEAKLVMTVSRLRDVLKATLGEKISNANNYYANDSFIEYSKAYDAIVKSIDDATTFEELNAIDVESLKAEAEAKLVTLADKLRRELIGLLGEKKANIDDYFTAESYEAYSSAFDTIITKLNEVTTVEALEKIDVLALKKDAEALLVKYIPDLETEPATEPATEPETEPESEPESESETATDVLIEDNGCGGCDSSAAISAIATVAIVGVALTMKKRKD